MRDYKVAAGGSDRLNTSSPFNIKVRSLTMRNFNAAEVVELYNQYTEDTGQVFTPEAAALAFEQTQGQPWLVNALAKEIVEELVSDESREITAEHILTQGYFILNISLSNTSDSFRTGTLPEQRQKIPGNLTENPKKRHFLR